MEDDDSSEKESTDEECVSTTTKSSSQSSSHIEPLPLQVIYRHKMSDDDIKALPRFTNHRVGEPSNILYLKNLHPKVSEQDLQAIFGHHQSQTTEKLKYRLLTGRMKGQAFVEFPSKRFQNISLQCLLMLNRYRTSDLSNGANTWIHCKR